jgi:hypothetical protein
MTTRVIPGSGAVFTPNFDAEYSVTSFTIHDGGAGYASTDPPKIEILGTKTPLEEGSFYPIIANGKITQIAVLNSGRGYFPVEGTSDTKVGIVTTEYVESSLKVTKFDSNNNPYVSVASTESHVVMHVTSGKGSAIFENGYNRTIDQSGYSGLTAPITPNYSGQQNRFWGFFNPFPSYFTTGLGTDAKFNAFIVYDSFTGDAISTSLVLRSGGQKYSIGDQVSISGTYFGGNTPANDISFTVSTTTNTRIGSEANNSYVGVPGETISGIGSGVILTLTRDQLGDIDEIEVTNGGAGYALTSTIGVSGTFIGGSTPGDDLKLSPEVLGANTLPPVSYIQKTDDNGFRVSGLSTTSPFITLRSYGIGTHSFNFENPNASSIILIDNIIQSALYRRDLNRTLTQPIGIQTTTIHLSGITSITSLDTIQVDSEYFDVKDVGLNGPNTVEVVRGTMGSEVGYHTVGAAVTVLRGDFNIIRDEIHFKSAPFGPIGPDGLEINSSFNGRMFSRQVDYGNQPNDKNVVFDDISTKFVGASSTEFFLESNTQPLVGIFTDTSAVLVGGIDVNLNPLVLINNVPQISGTDFDIDNDRLQLEKGNRIKFLTGTPGAGKISRTTNNSGLGYQRLVGAGGTIVVGAGGTIVSIDIQQFGSGYRTAPEVEVISHVGSGASLVANIGAGGVITSIDVIESGTGYVEPRLKVDIPINYSDIELEYATSPPGEGIGARASVVVGNRGDIIGFEMEEPGIYYKIGDRLKFPITELLPSTGISTVNVIALSYENTTGLTTVFTDTAHGLMPDDYVRLSGVAMTCESWTGFTTFTINSFNYDPSAGICTITTEIPHGLPEGDYIQLEEINLTCISEYTGITSTVFPYPAGINTFGDAYPQSSPNTLGGTYNVFRSISGTSGTSIVFNAGVSTITHLYDPGSFIQNVTPTDAYYDPLSGEFTVTSVGHTVTTNNRIQLLEGGFAFTCSMDNNVTEHYLPESDHFAIGRLLQVTGVTTDTFTAYVGAAGPGDFYTPSNASYNTSTGDITLTLGNHNVSIGDTIFIRDSALTFTCNMDSNQAQKTYPRPGIDPYANKGIEVTGVAGTTVTINVGSAGTDRFYTPSDADYNPVTGDLTVTVGQHGLGVGRNVVLADNSFTFTCALDGHGTQHNYPRPGIDPYAGKSIPITNVGLTTHTVTNAVYNATAGVVSFTVPNHGFSNSDYVKVDDNSLLFTCDLDGNTAIKAYPRPNYDFPSGRWMIISNSTTDTFEINVGPSTYTGNHTFVSADPYSLERQDGTFTINVGTGGTDTSEHTFVTASLNAIEYTPQSTHTFVSALTNSIARNPERYFTPSDATYNPISGDVVLTIGEHPFTKGEGIVLRPNSLSFTCDMDNNQSVKSYPRPGIDPYAARSIPVKDFTSTTITLNVGVSRPNRYYTPTDANYNPSTGNLTVTVGQHGLGVGRNVVLDDNSFTFTCDLDGNSTQHTYPRPGSDPYAGRSIEIIQVGLTTHTATDAPYNAVTGVVTLEVTGHGFSNGDYVLIEDNSLRYSCDLDGHSQWKYYPRPNYDYPSGRWLAISNVTTDTFDINVGESSYTGIHTFISATTDGIKRQDGTFTMYVGTGGTDTSNHTFVSASTNAIKHEPQSNHTFIAGIPYSVRQDIQAPHTFVRSSDDAISVYSYNGTATIGITSTVFPYPGASYNTVGDTFDVFTALEGTEGTTVVLNAGISTIAHTYDFGGTITNTPFTEFEVVVDESMTDKFSGLYPGQFIQFDDVSRLFNGRKRKFTLTVTEGNETKILSLKTKKESDMRMENNLFVFVNDVLQQPYYSYIWNGSRIVFKEAPLRNSKCTILFFRGSDLDVIQIDPPETIKEGDVVQIGENKFDPIDREQFERVVKKIISTDTLDTFTYDSLGINTDPTKERPVRWEKQTQDKIINGVLYSKARPSLRSRVAPITRLIKSVGEDDIEIYVNNAFPLFTDVDKLQESLRNIKIVDDGEIEPAIVQSTVSTTSSIESLTIVDGGSGFDTIVNPTVAISSAFIDKKDPIYNWTGASGISSIFNFTSVLISSPIVAVGSSNLLGISTDGTNWQESTIGYGSTDVIDFNSITFAPQDNFVAVGSTGTIVKGSGIGGTSMTWSELTKFKETFFIGSPIPTLSVSNYDDALNEIIYHPQKDIWIAVGDNRGVFKGVGIGTTTFYEKTPPTLGNLNSVAFNSTTIVAVGDGANIAYSNDGNIWSQSFGIPSTRDLESVIWTGTTFIAVGNQGTILRSDNGSTNWIKITPNISFNFTKIRYEYGLFVALNDSGQLYYSMNLETWVFRETNSLYQLNDLRFIPTPPPVEQRDPNVPVITDEGRFVAVGSAGTAIYAEPIFNRATGISTVTNGSVSSVTITNPGFGYQYNIAPPVIIESDTIQSEQIRSIKVVGDFGLIKNVSVGNSFINFELESERYDNTTLGIGYSSLNTYGVNFSELEVGDYFVITESNTVVGQALTGITTYSGGLNNYPDSKVGTAQSGGSINGIYRAERVSPPPSGVGIVTVRCMFAYGSDYAEQPITAFVDTTANTNGTHGRYSWGKIYDYQNRRAFTPKEFVVNTDNGTVGLSTAPQVYRTRTIK